MVQSETFLMNEWLSLATSWLLFLLLIGLWFYFSRTNGMRARGDRPEQP